MTTNTFAICFTIVDPFARKYVQSRRMISGRVRDSF